MQATYLMLRQPEIEIRHWRSYIRTRRSVEFLRKVHLPTVKATTAWIPLFSDWPYEIKQHLMLATALRLQGWAVQVVLGSRHLHKTVRFARAFGIKEFVPFDEFALGEHDIAYCRAHARELMRGRLRLPDIKEWMFHDVWIGPQVLSLVSRQSFGPPDPADEKIRRALASAVPRCLAEVMMGKRLISLMNAGDLLIVNEANYPPFGALVDLAIKAGVGVIQFTQPWRDDALLCRRLTKGNRRSHPGSVSLATLRLLEDNWNEAKEDELWRVMRKRYSGQWHLQRRNTGLARGERASDDVISRLALDPRKKTIVVFSHVLWDANLFYGEDLFDDYSEWFVETVRAACLNVSANWLIKLHPANSWKRAMAGVTEPLTEETLLHQSIGPLPGHVHLVGPNSDVEAWDLFMQCDVGVTVRGTAGLEMPCFGKPVLTAGTGRYSNLGFTIDSASRVEYLDRLAEAHEYAPLDHRQTTLARIHAYAALIARHWKMRSFRCTFASTVAERKNAATSPNPIIDYDIDVVARSLSDLENLSDLKLWAGWASSTAEDFVDPLALATV